MTKRKLKVFVSYRRIDSSGYAGRLYDVLVSSTKDTFVFLDVEDIPLGLDFTKVLSEAVETCDILLALIGPGWLDARNEKGMRRLEDKNDFVRVEISTAIRKNILIIPVLVDNASMPKRDDLPRPLKKLCTRQAAALRHASFHRDAKKLVNFINEEAAARTLRKNALATALSNHRSALLADQDRQTTIRAVAEINGTGVHSGAITTVRLHPAPASTGYKFIVKKRGELIAEIPATYQYVRNLTVTTVLGDDLGITVAGVEHLLAALRGLQIDNCYIEVDGREVPIMDGSAAQFVSAIKNVGTRKLNEKRQFIKVIKDVRIDEGDVWGEICPFDGFGVDVTISFETSIIGTQRIIFIMGGQSFDEEIAGARTFGFMSDIERLWKHGLALGSNLTNTIAIGENRIMNREPLRYSNEFVRHKALDAIGDLALSGRPLKAFYRSVRGGHRLNAMLVAALLEDRSAWTLV